MSQLKRLSTEAVEAALAKAERYRLLNEPAEAESICLDVLDVEPGSQAALRTLLLALTDQFERDVPGLLHEAQQVVGRMRDDYDRAYYRGIVHERHAKAQLHAAGLGGGAGIYEGIRTAMRCFEQAEAIRPHGNDDAILRWNACVRLLERHPQLGIAAEQPREVELLE